MRAQLPGCTLQDAVEVQFTRSMPADLPSPVAASGSCPAPGHWALLLGCLAGMDRPWRQAGGGLELKNLC